MSTSRSPALSGPSKKISSWVRPGVCEVRASALRPVSALIRLDLPTLERPAKAIDARHRRQRLDRGRRPDEPPVAGEQLSSLFDQPAIDVRGHAKALTPVIARSEATKQSTLSCRGEMDCFAALAMTVSASSRLRFNLLRGERRSEIVEQLHLHAVAAHDEALLQHREQVVPGPVD